MVITDTNVVVNIDFKDMIQSHIDSGADVTIAYNQQEIPESLRQSTGIDKGYYYAFDIEDGRITKIYVNSRAEGVQNFSMNMFVVERELLIELIDTAFVNGDEFFERDVLMPQLNKLQSGRAV